MQYQIQDIALNTAVVEVTRNFVFGDDVEWQCLTAGAFRPDLPLNIRLNASSGGGYKVMCHWETVAGEIISCFSMSNYWIAYSPGFAHDAGSGWLFASGVGAGNLKAGSMTWKKL